MPGAAIAMIGAGVIQAGAQIWAANKAADAQKKAAKMGIKEQRRQFDKVNKLLKPYRKAGLKGLDSMMDLMGLSGGKAQAEAIQSVKNSAMFGQMARLGEQGIMANASATGGLRSGTAQRALAQYRPMLLNSLVQQRYGQLANLATMGQSSAAMTGTAAQRMGDVVTQLHADRGAATAGAYLATGQAIGNLAGTIGGAFGYQQGQAAPEQTQFGQWGF